MNTQTKVFLFYLSLDEFEKSEFKNLIGSNNFNKLVSQIDVTAIMNSINRFQLPHRKIPSDDYDIAIMQVVKHIANVSESNIELAKSVEDIIGRRISRPGKRSKYELQGMLLEALMSAPRERLVRIRNQLIHRPPKSVADERNKTNLDRWFSIILGTTK
jgi:hypothetical protein